MSPRKKTKQALGTGAGVGVACVACCAPPIIAALGITLGLAAVAGLVAGIAGVVAVLFLGFGAITARRRQRRHPEPEPISVATPTRRPTPTAAATD
jgi:hypothetical protein